MDRRVRGVKNCDGIRRRDFVRIGGLAALGLGGGGGDLARAKVEGYSTRGTSVLPTRQEAQPHILR